MKIVGLDGKEYVWKISTANYKESNRSKLHLEARELIRELYPYDPICEEITLPGTKKQGRNSLLYADFYLPHRKIMIEVHGEQHYKFNLHFFKDKHSYYKAQARDRDKKEWCEINSITLIEFPYNEKKEWRGSLIGR